MKNSRLSNKFLMIFFFTLIFKSISYSNEPIDIWNLENKSLINEEHKTSDSEEDKIKIQKSLFQNDNDINFEVENLISSNKKLIGLYDPQENNLTIDMWKNSDSDQIKNLLKKIENINLSKDAIEILNIALLTNAYPPENLIENNEFTNFKINYLIKRKDTNLIKEFILKNELENKNKNEIIKFYINHFLENGDVEESCDLINKINLTNSNDYLDKFKIYCLIKYKKNDDAQIYYDLKKEMGFNDNFFDIKFSYLMGYNKKNNTEISKKNILNFHLSHITNKNFKYIPSDKTPKFIWKYLSSNNLLEKIHEVDLDNSEKIVTLEKATHEKNYTEKELLNLYRRFDFSLIQLLDAADLYTQLPNYKARALLYQRLLLSDDPINKIDLAMKMKKLFEKDKIENAFTEELSNILKNIDFGEIAPDQTTFYEKNIKYEKKKRETYIVNNKIIHQSKLLGYFVRGYSIDKATKETNDILKKVKANKKYVFTNKDKIILDSLIYDGVNIEKKYDNLYERNPNIPTDLQVYINNEDVGMILLRLVEIIGEDNIEDLGTETLYFITTTLNEINLDKIRNNILVKTLPQNV